MAKNKMTKALKKLDKDLISFICSECEITELELFGMDDNTLYDVVYEKMCDIECAETPSDNSPLTEHCEKAADIVTILGNAL